MHLRYLLGLALIALMTACGPASPSATTVDRSDPAAVNTAWLAAIQANDIDAALALYDGGSGDANAINVKNYMEMVARRAASQGALQQVATLSLVDHGPTKRAYTLWSYEQKALCFTSDLNQLDGKWTVTGWYAKSSGECAPD